MTTNSNLFFNSLEKNSNLTNTKNRKELFPKLSSLKRFKSSNTINIKIVREIMNNKIKNYILLQTIFSKIELKV